MEEYKITSEIVLSAISELDNEKAIEVINVFTGIKIIEAVDILTKDFSTEQKAQLMSEIDEVINIVL